MSNDFRHLSADHLVETDERLASRVCGRFPEAGLCKVASTVVDVLRDSVERSERIQRPIWALRIALGVFALLILVAAIALIGELGNSGTPLSRLLAFLDQTKGAVVWLAAVGAFFWTLETRIKRWRAVKAIHELRALAHIIDMHQLTKDPDCGPFEPKVAYPREDLLRYLHHCTELLAIISKIGQLYVQDFPDGTTLATVDQLENLATGLSQKVWQKIMILGELIADEGAKPEQGA